MAHKDTAQLNGRLRRRQFMYDHNLQQLSLAYLGKVMKRQVVSTPPAKYACEFQLDLLH